MPCISTGLSAIDGEVKGKDFISYSHLGKQRSSIRDLLILDETGRQPGPHWRL